ncbi:class I SAM-dependent methyltransferase [Aestuariivita boseongensis]|uniref:class I SAM-dependent methyltransferase n=1 Tax=Aestuariivita boseongensis TaxID=1470562 RepID=UPI000681F2E3|nr:class I SAM-dependent methyltransferase [Aestuariivita boseongensis]
MTQASDVEGHYSSGQLLGRIKAGLDALGLAPPLSADDLAPVDEFHIGGRLATEPFVAAMGLSTGARVVDLGCGLGGPARYVAGQTGARVTGVDLTDEFVQTGRALCDWTGLGDKVTLKTGSILDLPLDDSSMDAAYMIHVGMNIADKAGLAREAARVLKPGGLFAIYDVMQVGPGEMDFPAPWASDASQSALASPEEYRAALEDAGFTIRQQTDRTGFAKDFFAKLAAAQTGQDGPPPLGLHLIMGADTGVKVQHMVQNIAVGRIAPIEMIAHLA